MSYTAPPLVAIKEANVHLQALFERNISLEKEVNDLHAVLVLKDKQEQCLLAKQESLKLEYEEKLSKQWQTLTLEHQEKLREQQRIFELEKESLIQNLTTSNVEKIQGELDVQIKKDEISNQSSVQPQSDEKISMVEQEEAVQVNEVVESKEAEDFAPEKSDVIVEGVIASEKSEVTTEQEVILEKADTIVDEVVESERSEITAEQEAVLEKTDTIIDEVVETEKSEITTAQEVVLEKTDTIVDEVVESEKSEVATEQEVVLEKTDTTVDSVIESGKTGVTTEQEAASEKVVASNQEIVSDLKENLNDVIVVEEKNQEIQESQCVESVELSVEAGSDLVEVCKDEESFVITEQPTALESLADGLSSDVSGERLKEVTEKQEDNIQDESSSTMQPDELLDTEDPNKLKQVVSEKVEKILSLENEIARIIEESRKSDALISDLRRKGKILEEILKYKSEMKNIVLCMEKVDVLEVSDNNDVNNNGKETVEIETNV